MLIIPCHLVQSSSSMNSGSTFSSFSSFNIVYIDAASSFFVVFLIISTFTVTIFARNESLLHRPLSQPKKLLPLYHLLSILP